MRPRLSEERLFASDSDRRDEDSEAGTHTLAAGPATVAGRPGMPRNVPFCSNDGRLAMSSCVYGWSGCVKMSRTGETSTNFPAYITPESVHELGHEPHVVPHQDHGGSQVLLYPRQRLHYLPLHHHVQGAGGLVGDDHFGA